RIEGCRYVSLDSNRYVVVSIDLGGITVNVDDLLARVWIDPLRRVFLQIVAHAYDYIGAVEAEIDIVAAHEAERAERVGMIVGKDSLSHKRGGHRDVEPL